MKDCDHKWSAPVVAPYTYRGGWYDGNAILTNYDLFVSCEKCGEIKKHKN